MWAEALLELLNYVGIAAFAVSGALKAGEKGMDLLGFLVLGFSTALAGGIMRDVLLGRTPPANIADVRYPLVAIAASLATFLLFPRATRYRDYVLYPDAVGLGTFAAIGADVAVSGGLGHNPLAVMMMSALTAAGGGVVRDLLAAEVPAVLRREIYATAASLGGLIYMAALPLGREAAMACTAAAVTAVRLMALWRRWELPKPPAGNLDPPVGHT